MLILDTVNAPAIFAAFPFAVFFAENLHVYIRLGSSETIGSKIIAVQPSDGVCFNSSTQYEGMTKN